MDDFNTEQLRAIYAKRNNWGRWGENDERGTVNLIDERATLRGVASARTGKTISLSRPMRAGGGAVHNPAPVSFMVGTRPHRTPDSGVAELGRHRAMEKRHRHQGSVAGNPSLARNALRRSRQADHR
jgi:hypothetical protein